MKKTKFRATSPSEEYIDLLYEVYKAADKFIDVHTSYINRDVRYDFPALDDLIEVLEKFEKGKTNGH